MKHGLNTDRAAVGFPQNPCFIRVHPWLLPSPGRGADRQELLKESSYRRLSEKLSGWN